MRFISIPVCLLIAPLFAHADNAAPAEGLTEISVVGDAPYIAPPDSFTIDISLDQTGASASEAFSQLDNRVSRLTDLAHSACPESVLRSRGDKFLPATSGSLTMKSGAPLNIQRTVSVDCSKVESIGKMVDGVLGVSGTSIVSVSYFVRNGSSALISAAQLAAKRGAEKANALASSLGVKLGSLVSSVLTEEPEGDALREQLHRGQPALDYGDKELRVYVTLRYNIAR